MARLPTDRTHRLTVQGLMSSGEAFGFVDDVKVAVWGGLPGEETRVSIVAQSRHRPEAHAKLLSVETESPLRRSAPCRHHGVCHGCPWQGMDETGQREEKKKMLARDFGLCVDDVVPAPELWGYRWSSKRVVGGRKGALCLGSYQRRRHVVAPMQECKVDHPAIAQMARQVEKEASALGLEPYDERTRQGLLRAVWFKTNRIGNVLVTLVAAADSPWFDELARRISGAAGLTLCIHEGGGNALRGTAVRLLSGQPHIDIDVGAGATRFGAMGFLQPNPVVAAMAYAFLVEKSPGESSRLAFDLYAGAGQTTSLLRSHFDRVMACERFVDPENQAGVQVQDTADFLREHLRGSSCPDRMVANPPRAGLGSEVCALINAYARQGLSTLRIMSCSPKSLARDLALLVEKGEFVLEALRAFDTLPQTPHVELVARLRRQRPDEARDLALGAGPTVA